eukprot:6201517-Pleurochrysis_carterae.AAC.1
MFARLRPRRPSRNRSLFPSSRPCVAGERLPGGAELGGAAEARGDREGGRAGSRHTFARPQNAVGKG